MQRTALALRPDKGRFQASDAQFAAEAALFVAAALAAEPASAAAVLSPQECLNVVAISERFAAESATRSQAARQLPALTDLRRNLLLAAGGPASAAAVIAEINVDAAYRSALRRESLDDLVIHHARRGQSASAAALLRAALADPDAEYALVGATQLIELAGAWRNPRLHAEGIAALRALSPRFDGPDALTVRLLAATPFAIRPTGIRDQQQGPASAPPQPAALSYDDLDRIARGALLPLSPVEAEALLSGDRDRR